MYAVVVRTAIQDPEQGLQFLREEVVPFASKAPGFLAGYWARLADGTGISMLVFDSQQAAHALTEQTIPPESTTITLESAEVGEIVAHA